MFVMTIDQRGSTGDRDRVPELIARLTALTDPANAAPANAGPTNAGPANPGAAFERSVGDEVQGVLARAGDVVDAALLALRSGHWYVGIGVGHVVLTPGASSREGSGSGFVAARQAVEAAKGAGAQVPLSVVCGTMGRDSGTARSSGENPAGDEAVRACANAEAVLRLLGRLVQERTEAQWRVVDTLHRLGPDRHGRQKQAASELGITEQSVSRTIIRSGWQEEWAARPAAAMLLDYARSRTVGPGGNQEEG